MGYTGIYQKEDEINLSTTVDKIAHLLCAIFYCGWYNKDNSIVFFSVENLLV